MAPVMFNTERRSAKGLDQKQASVGQTRTCFLRSSSIASMRALRALLTMRSLSLASCAAFLSSATCVTPAASECVLSACQGPTVACF